jgi:Flp pilus assembly pilin Flp
MMKNDKGASAVEYAILLASIALAIYSGVFFFGQTVAGQYSHARQQLFDPPAAAAPAPAPAAPASPDDGGLNGGGDSNPMSPGGVNPSSGKYGAGHKNGHNHGNKGSMLARN